MRDDVDAMVGRRLRMRRRLLDLSQQDLANICGVTFQQIQKYEAAKCRMPVATLWRLAYALEVDVSYFFAGLLDEKPPAPAPRAEPAIAATAGALG
ncbi:helix-turn-helix transcriptional regulator [Phenylobacterium sp.]|uniref:helix-turn-helix domain-containing protein n=1 Tax=Phenylobacterium sp. TaxID=1871053 RepID=UPI002CC9366E|nr:helix-turn-helix transcriptional regulator [Phenylobacterium sp.]HLZ74520.1 helix-turn-helix transcriptional regulator [Phenylobacterium sp.]